MSLYRQLLLAVIASVAVAFAGGFVATMLAARGYIEEQIAVKNADNAAALALSMSQLPKDRVTIELQIVSLFETGQYQSIRVLDNRGVPVAAQEMRTGESEAPAWFIRLLPLVSKPGVGLVSDGPHRFGTLELKSLTTFAYRSLYRGAQHMLIVFIAAAVAMGLLAVRVLGRIRQPLQRIIDQAQAITERRYFVVPLPDVPELRQVGEAMNSMVMRVKVMFDEEAARLEAMRFTANHDELTGLANRGYFLNKLRAALDPASGSGPGALLLFRLRDLGGINSAAGRATTDALIRAVAEVARANAHEVPEAAVGRLNGADFALLLPGYDAGAAAVALSVRLNALPQPWRPRTVALAALSAAEYAPGEDPGALLARLDSALTAAERSDNENCVALAPSNDSEHALSAGQWRDKIGRALETGQLRLDIFDTRGFDGALLHGECFARLRLDEDGAWLPAAYVLPHVARLRMTAEFDLAAARALGGLGNERALALNLSPDSLGQADFPSRLAAVVADSPGLARRLWIDVPEKGIFQFTETFRQLLASMKSLGCRVGADHCGREFDRVGRLHGIGLDYVKVDANFIRDLAISPGNQNFLKGACAIYHSMGFAVYAIGVTSPADLALLPALGFDGATGPALSEQS